MAIGVQWQDEDGQVLSRYEGPLLGSWLQDGADECSACLRFIDPYGDTTFNQFQIPVLLTELESLLARKPDFGAQLGELIRFVSAARDQVHTYVKFIGD